MRIRIISCFAVLMLLVGCAQGVTSPLQIPARNSTPINSPPPLPTLVATAAGTWREYRLAFASVRDITPGIYVTDLCGRSVQLVTHKPLEASHPAWSPDGTRLAFTAKQDNRHELFVVNVDGTNLVQLTRDQGDNFSPAWSPDSRHLAFATNRDGVYQIYRMQADGTQVQRLTDTQVREEKPAWSPDGTHIAFMSTRDGNAEVYVMSADGSNPTRLTDHPASDLNPAWSPDGTQIAFNSTRGNGKFGIYLMTADGSNVHTLLWSEGVDLEKPAWSPDGKQIAFYARRDSNSDIYVMKTDGTDLQRITTEAGWDAQPAWSPQPFEAVRPLQCPVLGSNAERSFVCPVTRPNGSRPPGETATAGYHGNDALWTALPDDGILYVRRETDGRLSTKLPWWRGRAGTLTVEGRLRDETSDDGGEFSADVPAGYGDKGFQASGVYFSREGCWELTGRIGSAELNFVVTVKIGE